MKNSEIMARALADASGVPLDDVQRLVTAVQATLPPGHKLNTDVPEAEAARLLKRFRAEQDGIRQWLSQGYLEAMASDLSPAPLK